MSADAKAWKEGAWWQGIHDACDQRHEALSLSEVLTDVEQCGRYRFAWEFRTYPDGQVGLVGYIVGGSSIEKTQKQGGSE